MQSDNLISLKDDMVAFIAGHGMRRLTGYITEEVPTVIFEDDSPDAWKDFVELSEMVVAGRPLLVLAHRPQPGHDQLSVP